MNDRFDSAFRKRLLMALCSDPDFFRKAVDFLRPEMIIERPIQFAYSVILRCYEREGQLPSADVLQLAALDDLKNVEIPFESKPSGSELDEYIDTISMACAGLTMKSTDQTAYMSSRLKDFLQMCYIAAIPNEATPSQRLEMYSQIYNQMQSYDSTASVNALTLDEALARMSETVDIRNRIGTGLSSVDVPLNGGLAPGEIGLIVAPSGTGKAVPNYTMIPTPDGFRMVGDIRVGDRLFGKNGSPVTVTDVFPQPYPKEIYKVRLSDGRVAECCAEHLWEASSFGHKRSDMKTVTTEQMRSKIEAGGTVSIPVNEAVEYAEKELPIDPYILGVLLGNGGLTCKCLTISSGDEFVTDKVARILGDGYKFTRYSDKNYNYLLKKDGHLVMTADFMHELPSLRCTSGEKFIPTQYLTGSITQRTALMSGLIDTDGSVGDKGRLSFSTTSIRLAGDVLELVRSLGLVATVNYCNRPGKNTEYVVRIQGSLLMKSKLVTLPRKKNRIIEWMNEERRNAQRRTIRVVSVEKTGKTTGMTCFKVDAPDHLWLMNDYIVTHNSNAMLNFACENALRGNQSLYITLELSQPTVLARIIAMLTGIKASQISKGTSRKAMEEWTESERRRFHALVDRDGANRHILEAIKILEFTDRHVTPDTLKQEILKWKEAGIKSGIDESKLGFVAVDWLNNIDPSTLSMVNKNQNQAYVMEKVTEALRQMGSSTETRVWTAQQAARSALNKEVLTMQDGRDSSGTFNPVDIAMGLAIKKDTEKGAVAVRVYDNKSHVKMDPDREMIWSIMKDRNSGATGSCIKFYQGPSLKFYESKKECQRAELINNQRIFNTGGVV